MRVKNFDFRKEVLEKVLLFKFKEIKKERKKENQFHLFEVGEGGIGAQVIVEHNELLPDTQSQDMLIFFILNRYMLVFHQVFYLISQQMVLVLLMMKKVMRR